MDYSCQGQWGNWWAINHWSQHNGCLLWQVPWRRGTYLYLALLLL